VADLAVVDLVVDLAEVSLVVDLAEVGKRYSNFRIK
jgi:hypothetical protein